MKLGNEDLVVLIPNALVGDGEPGEPLTEPVTGIIRALALAGWWPLDFGEELGNQGCVELWFKNTLTIAGSGTAGDMAEEFIEKGGDV